MKKRIGSLAYITLALLGCILTFVVTPATTHAFEISLDADNTTVIEPTNGMVLRDAADPPDERLGQAVLQLTYEPNGVRSLFNLRSIRVTRGSLNVGIQFGDGSIAVFNDVSVGQWGLADADVSTASRSNAGVADRVHQRRSFANCFVCKASALSLFQCL